MKATFFLSLNIRFPLTRCSLLAHDLFFRFRYTKDSNLLQRDLDAERRRVQEEEQERMMQALYANSISCQCLYFLLCHFRHTFNSTIQPTFLTPNESWPSSTVFQYGCFFNLSFVFANQWFGAQKTRCPGGAECHRTKNRFGTRSNICVVFIIHGDRSRFDRSR